jgi:hypothetical protein
MSLPDLFQWIEINRKTCVLNIPCEGFSGYPAEVLTGASMLHEDAEIMLKPVTPNELLCKIRGCSIAGF